MSDFESYIELKIYVDYDAHKAEPQTWSDPGCPESMELTRLIFVNENNDEIKTLEELKEYALNLYTYTLVEQAWEDYLG